MNKHWRTTYLPLLILTFAAFGIGTSEFVIVGLSPEIAKSLSVSVSAAGFLVTAYALGVTVGSPLVVIAASRMKRKQALIGLIGIFIVGNLACALAPGYEMLVVARVITALCHGAFFGIGSVVAAELVEPKRRARAIAMMFSGITLANVAGVPLGTALGQFAGWRATFWAVTAIGILAALGLALFLPSRLDQQQTSFTREFAALKNRSLLLALGVSVLAAASFFSVLTYIAPILQSEAGLSTHGVTLGLLLLGVAFTVGSVLGGKLADWRLVPSVNVLFLLVAVVQTVFALTMHSAVASMCAAFVWGVVAFAKFPALQTLVVNRGSEAPNLASTLNLSAFNLGNATGAWLGGAALAAGKPLTFLPVIAAVIALCGFALMLASGAAEGRRQLARVGRVESGAVRTEAADGEPCNT
ncbi:MFS transporter [Paraburkholderia rhizosphaerae]|uniref:DHA1 family inner membrane transport protein n=1 Tax=Paraburkholderia rhizosphaerae TaxID=480658 RepID=A0A4R8LIQ5_9BURK|nr:MFS transporter [Paraburkholderia rhizosphaerae]TDY43317.1 DHA1 family inner membrane transport protein [Paraburkholderia rhizosphaerae]